MSQLGHSVTSEARAPHTRSMSTMPCLKVSAARGLVSSGGGVGVARAAKEREGAYWTRASPSGRRPRTQRWLQLRGPG